MAPLVQVLKDYFCSELFNNNPFLFILPFLIPLVIFLKFTGKAGGTKKLSLPPSPPKLPFIGHKHLLGTLPHLSLRALSHTYGPIMLLQWGRPTLVVSSIEMAKQILRTHDAVFANRPRTWAADLFFYGATDIGFSPYGDYWKMVRRIGVSELWTPKSTGLISYVVEEEVEELVGRARGASLARVPFKVEEEVVNTLTDIISRCVLGRKYGGGNRNRRSVGELSKMSMELTGAFCFRDMSRFLGWIDVLTGLTERIESTYRELDAFLDQVIEEHRNSKLAEDGNCQQPSGKKCFIDCLLYLQKEGNLEIDLTEDNIKALLQDMFVGGTDTVVTTIEWAMTELMRHPTKMKKTQEEVRRVVGTKKSKVVVDGDDINQMEYLKHVIKETLRLHPPSPLLNARESSEGVKVAGYDVPPKTKAFVNVWAIQRDPKLWDRPEEFIPERFAENYQNIDFNGQSFELMPFGSGRRACPAILLGMKEVEHVLANFLYWFDWELPGGTTVEDLDMGEVFGLVAHKKIPLELVPVLHYP